MQDSIDEHIAAVVAHYKPLLTGNSSRLRGGGKLWAQFESAADACRIGNPRSIARLAERVNEMAVAQLILNDPALEGELQYEPDIIPDGRRIDFVIVGAAENTYIEVKTVNPRAEDSDANWQKHVDRREYHPGSAHYIVDKEWLGATLYGNSFSSRAHFLGYTREFEIRIAAAAAVRAGSGLLIFCGTGFAWHLSELEDFADYYLTGVHRADDPFSRMEQHALKAQKIDLKRNIKAFGFVERGTEQTTAKRCVMPVRGPVWPAHTDVSGHWTEAGRGAK